MVVLLGRERSLRVRMRRKEREGSAFLVVFLVQESAALACARRKK